jgi:hypothetical protein
MTYLSKYVSFLICILTLVSCNSIQDKARNTINKTGETVGLGTTEFVKGIKEGIDKTLQCKLETDSKLSDKGIKTGKFFIGHDSNGSPDVFTVYIIFDHDFKGRLTATVFDKNNQEYGRASLDADKHAGEAAYFDFVFDKRTEIESKSLFIIK